MIIVSLCVTIIRAEYEKSEEREERRRMSITITLGACENENDHGMFIWDIHNIYISSLMQVVTACEVTMTM